MIEALTLAKIVFSLGAGVVCLYLAAITLRVVVDLVKAGPSAADEAYRNGDSLKAWWTGDHPNPTNRSLIGRHHKTLGVVMKEVGSRNPRWMR